MEGILIVGITIGFLFALKCGANPEMNLVYCKRRRLSNDDKTFCVICTNNIEVGSFVSTLECGHKYHSKCLRKWASRSRSCPLCRLQIRDLF